MCITTPTKYPKVSVVLPVYNSNGYITQALDSLLSQSLKEIEIVVVLDNPTDGSDVIARRYAEMDSRIKLIANEGNMHIGLSRNIGIENSTAEYVGFFDHDDYCSPWMYEKLYDEAKVCDADIVFSVGSEVGSDGSLLHQHNIKVSVSRNCVFNALVTGQKEDNGHQLFAFVHTNIYKRLFLQNQHIEFVDTRYVAPEDVIFNTVCSFFSHTIAFVDQSFYYHRVWSENEALKPDYNDILKRLSGFDYLISFLKEHSPDMIDVFCKGIGDKILWFLKQSIINSHSLWRSILYFGSIVSREYMPMVFKGYINPKRGVPNPTLRMLCVKGIYISSLFIRSAGMLKNKYL